MGDESTIESESPDRPTEHLEVEAQLHELLEDYDRNRPPEPDRDTSEFEERIAELEGERASWARERETLEGNLSEQTSRADENEGLINDAVGFHDEARDWMDQHDHGRLLDHLARETGADRRVLDLEVKMKLLEDADFREAADARFDDPDRFEAVMSEFQDDMIERYPRNDDSGLTSAVMAARDVSVSRDHGEFGGIDVARMSPQEFAQHSREVFAAMKRGGLKGARRRGGGWSTMPD